VGLTDGDGLGEAQEQSASSEQLGLTQRLVPPTVKQLKPEPQSALVSQVSKQAETPPKFKVISQVVL
jgi:hypothetical protein